MDNKKGNKQVGYAKAKEFNKYAMEKGISPNFDSIRKADGYMAESNAMTKFYSNPDNVRKMKEGQKEYFSSKGKVLRPPSDRGAQAKAPTKFINPQVDPATGQVLQPQFIPNRAGTPDRSLNNMQPMGTIVDPGMQSAQQAQAFQKFNSIAQNIPPSPTQMKSPVNNYADPGTAQTIDNSLGAAEGVLAAQRVALMADDEEDEEDGGKKKLNKDQVVKLDSGETFKKTPKKSTKIYMR